MINSFGRLVAPDTRDQAYTMRRALPQISKPLIPRQRAYRDGPLLDQGPYPHCVGYACRGFIDGAPIMTSPSTGPSAVAIYTGAQQLDEWPGTDYDGTSVRGGMKYLQQQKHISGYVWGQSVDDAINWMNGGYGTLVVGTNWYDSMSSVDELGFMREPKLHDTPIGGHAWRWIWYDKKHDGILMRNSWGHDFGMLKHSVPSGYAYLRRSFAERLLREDGEIAAPTQVVIRPIL